jgi:ribosomal protein S18 acetylase RimI-like enzyme
VTTRVATTDDVAAIRELYERLLAELPDPDYLAGTWEDEVEDVEKSLAAGMLLLAEEDGRAVGFVQGRMDTPRLGWVEALYVVPDARRRGVARELLAQVAALIRERGAEHVGLEVSDGSREARALYDRLGFRRASEVVVASLDALDARLAEGTAGETFGTVYVQTDDRAAVERAVAQFIPRIGGSPRTAVAEPGNGWVSVNDEKCSADPKLLVRLGRELSERMGAVVLALGLEQGAVVRFTLFERGTVMDEYLSLQEYYGPLPPGDVVALAANPRVVARLTGADPATVRAAARHDETPPHEILADIAAAIGIEPPA